MKTWVGHQIVDGAQCQILHWNLANKHEIFSTKNIFLYRVLCFCLLLTYFLKFNKVL